MVGEWSSDYHGIHSFRVVFSARSSPLPTAIHRFTVIQLRTNRSPVKHPSFREADLPLLITGVAGVPGYNAFFHFRKKYGDRVVGQRIVKNWQLQSEGIVPCDVEDTAEFSRLLRHFKIKTILNCGGSCALKSCELDPAMAERVNIFTVQKILEAIEDTDIHLVHLSIDLVYSGLGTGGYVETDPTDPVTVYGQTMVVAENAVMQQRPSACILRISLPMGISFNGHAGAIDWIQNRFAKNRPATLYIDEIRTPTYVECMNEVFEEVIARRLSGLFHAGGSQKLSLFQIAQIVNRVGGYDPCLLKGCPRIEAGPIPPRAGNVTMNSQKLIGALGRDPFVAWPLKKEHLPDHPEWHFGRTGFAGSKALLVSHLYDRPI
jgi:dTDP-4-dehydrorhamnose reductase